MPRKKAILAKKTKAVAADAVDADSDATGEEGAAAGRTKNTKRNLKYIVVTMSSRII